MSRFGESIGGVNPDRLPGPKLISRRRAIGLIGGGLAVAAATAAGVKLLDQDGNVAAKPVEGRDPAVFDPTAREGSLDSQNTRVLSGEEALRLVEDRTKSDHEIYFIPPAGGEAIQYKDATGERGLNYTEWNGFPVGTIINTPYSGKLNIQIYEGTDGRGTRLYDEKYDYRIIDVVLDPKYEARETLGMKPVLRFAVPPTTNIFFRDDQFNFAGTGSTRISSQVDVVAGQPLFAVGSQPLLIEHGIGSDHPRQFITYESDIAVQDGKAIITPTPPSSR